MLRRKADRTKLFELYILSIVNASVITAYSIYKMLVLRDSHNTRGCTRLLASALGYFCHDFVAMRREFKNDRGMLIHHILGISLITMVMKGQENVKRFVAPVAMIELSTIFLSGMWLLRETGRSNTIAYKLCLGAFASTFFGTRIVGLNYNLA